MDEVGKEKHVVELGLQQEVRIPIEIDQSSQLHRHPHRQIKTGNRPELQDDLLVSTPFECLLLHRSSLNENTRIDQNATQRDHHQRRVVVHEQIEIVPLSIVQITRIPAEQIPVTVMRSTRPDEDKAEVEQRRIRQTEEKRTVV